MTNLLEKAFSFLLAGAMLTGAASVAVAAVPEKEQGEGSYYNGVFYYRPGLGEVFPGTDSVDYYAYSDDFFKASGKEYNPHLATMSMALAEASVSSTREPKTEEGYRNMARNAVAILEDNGFVDIDLNEDYTLKPAKDTMGVGCAHKKITDGDREYTLLVIFPRNAGYEAEWGNNFVLGAEGDAKGFDDCAEACLAFAKDYIERHSLSGDCKVWTVGYSRGGAVANLMGKKLIDAPNDYLGNTVTLDSENLYDYTFGTPSAADVNNDPRNERYAGIFNSYENTELASAMAPAAMGFERYGTDRMIFDEEKYDAMLANLEITNKLVHDTCIDSIGSRHYVPKKLSIVNGSVALVDDQDSYLPYDPAEYLEDLGAYLTVASGGRENYAAECEQALSDLIAYYEGLADDDAAAFTSGLMNHDETIRLVASLYVYFMKANWPSDQKAVQATLASAKEIAAVGAAADGDTGIDAAGLLGVSKELISLLLMDTEGVKTVAAGHLSAMLTDAMTASRATQEQIAAVTNEDASKALVHLLSHIAFGNIRQSKSLHPLIINNEQMKNAATLLGNAANLFVDHTNEIVISWLRVDDSWFADYAPLTETQLAGYRRVYIDADKAVNGTILDAENHVVGVIENGALTSVTDHWIGMTTSDNGDFFRIPADKSYTISLVPDGATAYGIKIGEYSPYTAETAVLSDETVAAGKSSTVTVSLPAPEEGFSVPSKAAYSVTVNGNILGDVNGDGTVTITDATLLQQFLAEMTPNLFNMAAADVNGDGKLTISDVTALQRYLAEFENVYPIGTPM